MSFRQFAFHNIRRNTSAYIAYFSSSSFAVMTLFTYLLFIHHPDIAKAPLGKMASVGMEIASYITFIFSFLFVLYSISAFLRVRLKEFGILTILGAQRKQLNWLIFLENMIIGTISVATGILGGLIFAKLFLLFGENVLELKNLPMYVPVKAIWITVAAFMALFFIMSSMTSFFVRQSKALEMLQGSSKPKKEPKASIWLALLSVITLSSSVYVIQRELNEISILYALLLDLIGLYFFFTQLSVVIIRLLKKNRRIYWHGINLLWISELAYKVKDNARMFFMITMVTTVACTSAGIVLALKQQAETMYKENPFAFTVYSEDQKQPVFTEKIEQTLKSEGIEYKKFPIRAMLFSLKGLKDQNLNMVRQSEYKEMARSLSLPIISLQDYETLLIQPTVSKKQLPADLTQLTFANEKLPQLMIKKQFKKTLIESVPLAVVNDHTYDQMTKTYKNKIGQDYYYFIPSWNHDKVSTSNSTELKISTELENWDRSINHQIGGFILSRGFQYQTTQQGTNVVIFIGLFIVAIFSVFIASFLYFKLFSDLQQDKRYYHGLSKIGLSLKEMKRTATNQIALLFYIPIFFAGIQTMVGISILGDVYDTGTLTVGLTAIGIFVAIQTVYFFIVRARYLAQLKNVMV
ncbi:putative ABC transport system permease protein [Croceifilum oryzae]|uniref:ABC transport system permease protein n=1 Tax=Croceifilum oryzae TaxID=1553429 RepID=A0AAJ1TMX6_9BACL|nr:ABC transporter permease [Croceifilum oryzae]MDQ0417481.1 putative ABC transport system permease protein [Croceifilum oryzae]